MGSSEPRPDDDPEAASGETPSTGESLSSRRPNDSATGDQLTEIYIESLRSDINQAVETTRSQMDSLLGREHVLFVCLVVTGCLGVAMSVAGIVLIVSGLITVGALSALVGLLGNAGTLVFQRLTHDVKDQRGQLSQSESHREALLESLFVIERMTDEDQRNASLGELLGRVMPEISRDVDAGRSRRKKRKR
jgi:hypothetical protein